MTKTCCSSIVMACGFFFSLSSSCPFFFSPSVLPLSFFLSLSSSCLFLRLLLISFLFSSPISFLNFVLFLSLFLLSRSVGFFFFFFFVGLSSTFYGFLCYSIYGLYLGWYGILMVISSFWSDLWVWSSDLRCGCGVWIFEMWLWVWVWEWGLDFVVWLWWFEFEMWLWVSVWDLDLWCGYGRFGSEMWWPFLSLPLWVWVYVCMFKTILICFIFDFQIWWLLGREIKEENDNCKEKNERGIEREKISRVWTFLLLLPFWIVSSTTFELKQWKPNQIFELNMLLSELRKN